MSIVEQAVNRFIDDMNKNQKINNAIKLIKGKDSNIKYSDIRLYDENAIELAIKFASFDLMTRTLSVKTDSNDSLDDAIKNITNKISGIIKKGLFTNDSLNEEQFDEIHHKMCEDVVKELNEVYEDVHYGKAQKLINMTFKHLYCFADKEQREQYFACCHMPLDRFTLEWFSRMKTKNNAILTPKPESKQKTPRFVKGCVPSWSSLKYKVTDDCPHYFYIEKGKKGEWQYTYQFFVDEIRNIISKRDEYSWFEAYGELDGLTPLEAEFVIWPEIQLHLSAEAFIAAMKSSLEEPEETDKDSPLGKKIKAVRDLCDAYCGTGK